MGAASAVRKAQRALYAAMLKLYKKSIILSSFIICTSHVFATKYLWPIKNTCSLITWEKKNRCLGLIHLRVNTCLEKGRGTEHTHTCQPTNIHLQLFPAYFLILLPVGVAAVTWQWKCMFLSSIQGKFCQIREPFKLAMSQEQSSCKNNSTSHSRGQQRTMFCSLRSF